VGIERDQITKAQGFQGRATNTQTPTPVYATNEGVERLSTDPSQGMGISPEGWTQRSGGSLGGQQSECQGDHCPLLLVYENVTP